MARELRVLDTTAESHQLDTVGDRVRLDLTDRWTTVLVGDVAGTNTEIEITPTGPLAGDYFVGTFDGARMVGLVRLGEGYDTVREIDHVALVAGQRDVSEFPRIAAVADEEGRRLEIASGGLPTRVELQPLAEAERAAA
jgi:hypothetical protein